METTIIDSILGFRCLGLYRDNGKENGDYYSILGLRLQVWLDRAHRSDPMNRCLATREQPQSPKTRAHHLSQHIPQSLSLNPKI